MIDQEFSPEKFIDRDAERELFNDLLKFEDARLLTIRDAGGRGKSSLLKQLRYECGYLHDPPKLVSLVLLDQLSDYTPFTLITKIKSELTEFADMVVGLDELEWRFSKFDRLNEALRTKDFTPFHTLREERRLSGDPDASPQVGGGSVTGWSPDKEDIARRECVRAFFEELKQISSTQTVIVLLDSWERSESDLREWIVNRIVRPLCFDMEGRPKNFGLVLAGRELPDFKQRMGNEDRYHRLVKSIESLGLWEEDHVRAFLQAYGYEDVSNEGDSVSFIHSRLRSGLSLIDALQLAEAVREFSDRVG